MFLFGNKTDDPIFNVKPYDAPELVGIEAWLNSEPLTLQSLKGQVVIIDFWTFGCINCKNTLPHVVKLYNDYRDSGLEIIGVHTPEFDYEKRIDGIKTAVEAFNIDYPIAIDNEYKTWRAYKNHYWPAFYFIDKKGQIRRRHFGEGEYDLNEQAVIKLLAEAE